MTTNHAVRGQSALMVGVDSALAAGALLAPGRTLRLLGHREPSEDAMLAGAGAANLAMTIAYAARAREIA